MLWPGVIGEMEEMNVELSEGEKKPRAPMVGMAVQTSHNPPSAEGNGHEPFLCCLRMRPHHSIAKHRYTHTRLARGPGRASAAPRRRTRPRPALRAPRLT